MEECHVNNDSLVQYSLSRLTIISSFASLQRHLDTSQFDVQKGFFFSFLILTKLFDFQALSVEAYYLIYDSKEDKSFYSLSIDFSSDMKNK